MIDTRGSNINGKLDRLFNAIHCPYSCYGIVTAESTREVVTDPKGLIVVNGHQILQTIVIGLDR